MDEHAIKIHKGLYPIAWLYRTVVAVRNRLFDWGILKSRSFDMPVICVGNIAAGGTGKTPHTEYLIKLLSDRYRVAVLSRGYKRRTKGFVLANADSTARTIGDEPYQMYLKFPTAIIAVDEDRCRGIEKLMALKEPPVEVILLDDAFQHRYVKPGLNILLTDYHRLFCDDALLPAGRLREPMHGKNRAQIVIVTKCPKDIKPIDYNIITKRLSLYPYQQLYFSTFTYGALHPVFPEISSVEEPLTDTASLNEKRIALSELKETEVLLVTGIASPDAITEELKRHAKRVVSLSFGDHHAFGNRDFQAINERFNKLTEGHRLIVTTEKDAARLLKHPALDQALKPFIYALPIEIEILQQQQNKLNQQIINYVREDTRNRSLSKK